ncbi:MAG: hypothetical protein WCI67_04800, partial [Chloroflexales bacterium]
MPSPETSRSGGYLRGVLADGVGRSRLGGGGQPPTGPGEAGRATPPTLPPVSLRYARQPSADAVAGTIPPPAFAAEATTTDAEGWGISEDVAAISALPPFDFAAPEPVEGQGRLQPPLPLREQGGDGGASAESPISPLPQPPSLQGGGEPERFLVPNIPAPLEEPAVDAPPPGEPGEISAPTIIGIPGVTERGRAASASLAPAAVAPRSPDAPPALRRERGDSPRADAANDDAAYAFDPPLSQPPQVAHG